MSTERKVEYKVIDLNTANWFSNRVPTEKIEEALNRYGAEGWDLSASFDRNNGNGKTSGAVFILKRYV